MSTNQIPEFVFSSEKIARLRAYRAAVAAGFYTDQLPPSNGDELPANNTVSVVHARNGEILVFIDMTRSQHDLKEEIV